MTRRFWLAVTLAMSGCAAGAPPPTISDGRWDGVYKGTVTDDPACGTGSHGIAFYVSGNRISVHSRHQGSQLDGTVSPDGLVALEDPQDRHQVAGAIAGDRLTATESDAATSKHHGNRLAPQDGTTAPCVKQIDAVREPGAEP